MTRSWVVDPACAFDRLAARLAALGFTRDSTTTPATPDLIAGEPELAAWTRGDERLTYTFNPVVSLRVLAPAGADDAAMVRLAHALPLLDTAGISRLLAETAPRRLLLGLLAARVLVAHELAVQVAALCAHADATIRSAARATSEVLGAGGEADAREAALRLLRVLCEQAVPVVAELVGPHGRSAVAALQPRAGDYDLVFQPEIAGAVCAAYEELWRAPAEIEVIASQGLELRVHGAPASMLLEDNELSRHFPGGYRALAPYLRRDKVWFVWRYLAAGEAAGVRYDGLVRLESRWAWFPKPYRVVGELVRARSG